MVGGKEMGHGHAIEKPVCFLAWGRFLTTKEYRMLGGKEGDVLLQPSHPLSLAPHTRSLTTPALSNVNP